MPYDVKFNPQTASIQSQRITDATIKSDGVMTAAMVRALLGLELALAVDSVFIYADSVNGDDANDGSIDHPVQTVERAVALIPGFHLKECEVHFAPGTYSVGKLFFVTPKRLGPFADPITFIGESPASIFGNLVSDSVVGSTQIGNSGLATAENAYVGRKLTILSGANAGQSRNVGANNTSGDFTVNAAFDNPLTVGDEFVVTMPSVDFDMGTDGVFATGIGDSWCLKDIKFTGNVFFARTIIDAMEGVEFDGQGTASLTITDKSNFFMDGNPFNFVGSDPFTGLAQQASCYIHDTTLLLYDASYADGWAVMQNVFMDIPAFSGVDFTDIVARTFTCLIESGSYIGLSASDPTFPGLIDGDLFGDPTLGILDFSGNSFCDLNLTDTVINNSTGHGIRVNKCSIGALGNGLAGSGNAGVGCYVVGMSRTTFVPTDGENSGTTITGDLGDAQVGTDAPQAWSTLSPAGATQDLNRIEPVTP